LTTPATLPSNRRLPLQARSNETVRAILKAAAALLEKSPFEQITTSRIAAEAGVSIGALYRFYSEKQEIYDEIALHALENFREELAPLLTAKKLVFATFGRKNPLDVVLDAYIDFLDRHPAFRILALGRHISERTRESQLDIAPEAILKGLLIGRLKIKPGTKLQLKLRIAAETGDRLIAYAYAQESRQGRDAVLTELKSMLGRYLLPRL
jgi:AcrR family transcriptional regulator